MNKRDLILTACLMGMVIPTVVNAQTSIENNENDNEKINAHSVVQNTNLIPTPAYTTIITSEEYMTTIIKI